MVDEICTALPLDPIEFRRRNALATGGRTMAGNPYIVSIRTPEILDKLEKHPIWKQRADEKARGQQAGILVGTGVACATKDYGTGGDGCLGIRRNRSRRTDRHLLRRRRDGHRHWDSGGQSGRSASGCASLTKSRSRKSTHSARWRS